MLEIRVTAVPPAQADGLSAAEQVDMALGAIGFRRSGEAPAALGLLAPAASIRSEDRAMDAECEAAEADPEVKNAAAPIAASADAPRRRGRPRKEDVAPAPAPAAPEAAFLAAEPAQAATEISEPEPQIRTNPEDRVEPVPETRKLTHEDLRNALGRLSQKIGLAAAVAEVRALVGGGIQDVPDDQGALGAVLDKMEARIAGGEPLRGDAPAEPAKTHDDVKAAIVAYAKRYGQDAAKVDWKAIVEFPGRVDDMPVEKVAPSAAAIADAVEANPFGRARVDG